MLTKTFENKKYCHNYNVEVMKKCSSSYVNRTLIQSFLVF